MLPLGRIKSIKLHLNHQGHIFILPYFLFLQSQTFQYSMPDTDGESVNSFDAEDRDRRRRKEAYKLYKKYAKPTRENMCRILDYAKDTDVTRQDVDLLPWNRKETEVIKEVMQALKKEKEKDKKNDYANNAYITRRNPKDTEVIKDAMKSPKKERLEKKEKKKKDKKEKERFTTREDPVFAQSNGYKKDPALRKKQMGDSSTSLDTFRNGSSGSLDTGSSIWGQDRTRDHKVSAEQLRTSKVEEEYKRKKEERRRKREEATKKSMPQVDVQERSTAKDTKGNTKGAELDDRLERAFQWYTRMASPFRHDFKRRVADMESIDITPEDVDLLPWNSTGKFVNIAKMNAIIRASILKNKH
jgi:hypothetical protein